MLENLRKSPEACRAVVALIGLLSGALSGLAATSVIEGVPSWVMSTLPGLAYGALTGGAFALFGAATWPRAMIFAGAMLVNWTIGLNLAPLTCADWLTGGGLGCTLYAAGLLGGFVGTVGMAVVTAALFPALRRPAVLIVLVIVGTATGALLEFGPFVVFCGWQAGINAVLAYGMFPARR